jgi:hypothetical protein
MPGYDECGTVGGMELAGETEGIGENLLHRYFAHQKYHMT